MTSPRVAFVLPAGGSAGAAQVGILRALFATNIVPDVVVGSSVGALNAAFLACDPVAARVEELAEIWTSLRRSDVFGRTRLTPLARIARRRDHIYDPRPLRALIRRFCPLRDLEDASIPVHVATTDLDHGVARWWTTGPAESVLYASACLPGLFPPAVLDGVRHVDGGVLDPVPIRRAVDSGAATVYVVGDRDGAGSFPRHHGSALDVLLRSFAVTRYANLPDPERLARTAQRVVSIPGASTDGLDITDFSGTDALIDKSEQVALEFLEHALTPDGDEPRHLLLPAGAPAVNGLG